MATIRFKTLNSNLADALSSGKVPEKNVAEISENLKQSTKKDLKISAIVMGIVTVMMGGYLTYTLIASSGLHDAIPQFIGGFFAIIAFLCVVVYFAFVGIIKIQFNHALKEGYPELYKQYKI